MLPGPPVLLQWPPIQCRALLMCLRISLEMPHLSLCVSLLLTVPCCFEHALSWLHLMSCCLWLGLITSHPSQHMFFRAGAPHSCVTGNLWQAEETKFVSVILLCCVYTCAFVCACMYITCDDYMTILTEWLSYFYLQSPTQVGAHVPFLLCFPDLADSALSMFLSWETSQFLVQIAHLSVIHQNCWTNTNPR